MVKSIFVTNNGLLDNIGVAQVVPYISGLARVGHGVEVISVESSKAEDYWRSFGIQNSSNDKGVVHTPLFRSSVLPKRIDRLLKPSFIWRRLEKSVTVSLPDLIHCRSYMPLSAVLKVSRKYKIPFVFDMRGFWIDQRIEGGQWKQSSVFWRNVIKHFRNLESEAIEHASTIVVLTQEAREEVLAHPSYRHAPVEVIPCSVDQDVFRYEPELRAAVRKKLGFRSNEIVLTFLGASSPLYRTDVAYRLFGALKRRGVSVKLLFLGDHDLEGHRENAARYNVRLSPFDLVCKKVPHNVVPEYLNASDFGLSFIIQSFSSKGVSATKVGEYMSCGLPVIGSDGVGDIRNIIHSEENGWVLSDFSDEAIEDCADVIVRNEFASRGEISNMAKKNFDIINSVALYDQIYRRFERSKV